MKERRLRRLRERPLSQDPWGGRARKDKLEQKWRLSLFEDPKDVSLVRAKLEKGQLPNE